MKILKNKMELIYAREELPKKVTKSVFLAGPTLRSGHPEDMHSWREDAIKYLEELEFDGHVYIYQKQKMVNIQNIMMIKLVGKKKH